jgi:hypothetical protein
MIRKSSMCPLKADRIAAGGETIPLTLDASRVPRPIGTATGRTPPQGAPIKPDFREPMKDPTYFPWHQVSKVQHHRPEVNAMTKPTRVREDSTPDGGNL